MTTLRRQKGEGSITLLSNGKYRVRLECTPYNGKRKQMSATCTTKAEARKKLQELIARKRDYEEAYGYSMSLSDIIEEYLADCEHRGIRESTISSYTNALYKWNKELFRYPLDKLTFLVINKTMDKWSKEGMEVSTLKTYLTILSQLFHFAVKAKMVSSNPAAEASPPKEKRAKTKAIISVSEHQAIIKHLKDYYDNNNSTPDKPRVLLYPAYVLSYLTGLRVGEVAGLLWSDIDEANSVIHIRQQLTHKGTVTVPKTVRSQRDILVSSQVIEVLNDYKRKLQESNMFNSEFVFGRVNSSTLSHTFFREIKKILQRTDLSFHSIRHTHATMLLDKKVPITAIAERLGHSSPSITLNCYAHTTNDSRAMAAEVLAL